MFYAGRVVHLVFRPVCSLAWLAVLKEVYLMAAQQERIDAFIHEGSPLTDQPLEILCEGHVGTYVTVFMPMDRGHLAKRENTPTYRSCGDRLAGTKTKSALNLEVLSRSFAPV
jgi:hypothetical protein